MNNAPQKLAEALAQGDRPALARAITLIESSRPQDREAATELLNITAGRQGASLRVGISGVPGVGKSTFIERFGLHAIAQGHKVAVLAVDPSSTISGGSILGDKTRMVDLSRHEAAYVRPSPTGGTLGGVARRTRETMALCEAAGFDLVLIETVGVGQSEVAVADMTDMFVLLLLPGGGDQLQGIKRGIVELADLILINKTDGDLGPAAKRTAADYSNALRLLQPRIQDWTVPVETCSAERNEGVDEALSVVKTFHAHLQSTGQLTQRRSEQAVHWLWNETTELLLTQLRDDPGIAQLAADLERQVRAGSIVPTAAARQLVQAFLDGRQSQRRS
jgi:LAO/AO transport system kinase